MTPGTEIVATSKVSAVVSFTPEQIDLLKRTIAKGTTNDELGLFLEVCKRKGFDPFARQIYCVKRGDSDSGQSTMTIQVGIDGFRLQAERSGKYAGQTEVEWCDATGVWKQVWLSKDPPAAARVGVYRSDFQAPLYAVALFKEYAPQIRTKDGWRAPSMWVKMPANQLAKCAEAAALRKAFPEECGGLYAPEEMHRQDAEENAFKRMLNAFKDLKRDVGEEIYYRVLGAHGYEHANEIRNIEIGRKIHLEIQRAKTVSSPPPVAAAVTPEPDEWEEWEQKQKEEKP